MRKAFSDILSSIREDGISRLTAKVPQWAPASERLRLPGSLPLEQCSSSEAALGKASLIPRGARLADLTGGLGVDSWAFSSVCSELLYNERNPELLEAARHNFEVLGVGNVVFSGEDVSRGNLAFVEDFKPDWIYLDPARRGSAGGKLFRLADCSPDVTGMLSELYGICPNLMLKLSPMADIRQLRRELPGLKTLRIVGVKGECKELLCILERGYEGDLTVYAGEFQFTLSEERESPLRPAASLPVPGDELFEPSAVLSKAGCWGVLCRRFDMSQLGRDAHLFTGGIFPSEGKVFVVEALFPMGNEGIRQAAAAYPRAGVSARGLRMDSDSLRRRLGCRASADYHIFGIDSYAGGRVLICCKRKV